MTPKNSPTLNLKIDSLSFNGGRGVGRHEGVVVFVPETAPGDLIRARVTKQKSRFWEAELVEIINPSPRRRSAPCPVAARCGGCVWQHITYDEQIKQKEQILAQSFRALKKFGEWETLPFVKAPDEFHYRSRIQLQVEGKRFGFFAKRSHDLVETRTCLIAAKKIDAALKTLEIQEPTNRLEILVDENDRLHYGEGVFTQVNRAQNENLKRTVAEWIEGEPGWIYDLYAGSGNLTLPLKQKFAQAEVSAIELSAAATEKGRALAPNIHWHAGDMGQTLRRLKPPQGDGVIVLDPPRVGCTPEVPKAIAALKPKQIVYVSCNPTTFARDVTAWLVGGRYRLARVQGFDMFPQTEHVEMIASLCAAT